ncbi:MAG: ABC transporter permease [Clostridia bacterium]|nr:ABC transporter permease [Clostridia bacterium]
MDNKDFKTVINSKHRLFNLHLKEAFLYSDLIKLFVRRDFVAKYKQTILGPLWAIIQPLLTTVVFTLIFGSLANGVLGISDIDGILIPSFLFYMSGSVCWGYFSANLSETSSTFIKNRRIMGKVYYPRIATPIASSISNLISFTIQFVLFFIIYLVFLIKGGYDLSFSVNILFIPLIILELMIFSTGLGIIISSLTTKYKDLQMLVGFGLQILQFVSPIAYGLTLVSSKIPNLMWLYNINPITSIITTFRYSVFGTGYFNLAFYLVGWAISLLLFFLGLLLFSRIERNFMDTI